MPKATRPATSKELSSDATPPPAADAPAAAAPPPEPAPPAGPVTVHVSPGGQVTISVQPSPPLPVDLVPPDMGLDSVTAKGFALPPFLRGGDQGEEAAQPGAFEQVRNSLKNALEAMGKKFVEFADEVTTLEVRTFVSDRIEDVRPDGAKGFENAQQRAMTRIEFDGDTQMVVPVDAGQLDEALWKIHLQTVEAAQAHRAAMLKTIGELVQGFIPTLK